MEGIGDFLKDEQPSEANETPVTEPNPEAATAEPVAEEPKGPSRDEKGRFAPKETGVEPAQQDPVPPTEPVNQLPPHEYAALKDERRKRQEAEARAAAIEAHYAQLARQQQVQAPQQPAVDFWDDPQAFMDSRMAQLGETMLQQWEQRQQAQRLDASEQAARAKYPDYDEAFVAFEQAVQANPRLAFELAQQSDPGEFAYSKGKAALAIQSVGSLDALKAQIRAELEAEAKAAFNPAPKPVLPSTTAGDTSVGARSGPAWAGPAPIGDILRK
jgi:hypothetical protein